jgi:inosine-uridine nucleoside N-ribohydrolase
MGRIKVHLDTDIGGDIDDLCALALLLNWPDVEITGITTVLEHGGKRAGYARYALALAGRGEVPVAAGADVDPGRFPLPPEERYWPEPVPQSPGPLEAAIELLKRSVEQGAILVGIGPFTNLSLLERRYPGILRQATLCLMGGHVYPPPATFPAWDHEMDFNVQADSTAARHVLESADPANLTLVPIEVSVQTALRRSHLPTLRRSGPLGRLIARQAETFAQDERIAARYGHTCPGLPPDILNFQHDPLACAVALGWNGVTVESLPIELEMDGEWLCERIGPTGQHYRVVTGIDAEKFNAFWLERMASHRAPKG